MAIGNPSSAFQWSQNAWPWMTLNGYFALNSVFAPVWLAPSVRLSKNNCVKISKDTHTVSGATFGMGSTPCLKKTRRKLFLSELRQISTDFNIFWHVDGKMSEILRGVFIFHIIWSVLPHYLVKHRSLKSLLSIQCMTEFCTPILMTVQDNLLNYWY